MPLSFRQTGFSAAELAVVVFIVGVIAAIAIPSAVAMLNSYELETAATALEKQLNRCRLEAVRANLPMKIKVASHTSRIDFNRDDAFDANDGEATTLTENASITVDVPADGVVTFTSRGEMPLLESASFTITYRSMARVVTVDPRGGVAVGPEIAAP